MIFSLKYEFFSLKYMSLKKYSLLTGLKDTLENGNPSSDYRFSENF